ncbi:MAG: CHAD domain-containing protein [Sphingobacteriales bacterium]
MKKKIGKAYFNELWEHMVAHLSDFFKTGDQEKLHQFRLQVKKLRALLLLLDAASPRGKLSKDFKPVKNVFRHCGVIREAYINLQMAATYGLKNEEFVLSQVNEMERAIKEFGERSKKYLKTIKSTHHKLEGNLGAIGSDTINEFYKSGLEQIATDLIAIQFDDSLHNCRKVIKALLYNRKIAGDALHDKLSLDNSYLDKLQARIGDWHDNTLAIELFSAPGVMDEDIVARLKKENTRLKKSINTLAHDFWKKAVLTEGVLNGQAANVWV